MAYHSKSRPCQVYFPIYVRYQNPLRKVGSSTENFTEKKNKKEMRGPIQLEWSIVYEKTNENHFRNAGTIPIFTKSRLVRKTFWVFKSLELNDGGKTHNYLLLQKSA